MTVNLQAPNPEHVLAVPGVRLGIAQAGVRKVGRKDLTVILLDEGSAVAGVLTQNRFCAAPVQICRDHLQQVNPSQSDTQIRALIINTGNANAGTGAKGLADARATSEALAALLKLKPQQVLPFSTGVIMENLPVDRIVAGMPAAIADAQAKHWAKAAEGIMTTDTVPKAFSAQVRLSGQTVTVTGISKGAGMIRPNMATMLGFLATDANIDPILLPALATDIMAVRNALPSAESQFEMTGCAALRVAITMNESLVDVSPSMVMRLKDELAKSVAKAGNKVASMLASVAKKPSMVAMLGRIMPAPLLMPVMVTV